MIREIVKDERFLALPSRNATLFDLSIADDLENTLRANLSVCVGMAANMIGQRVKIMAIAMDTRSMILINPVIVHSSQEYETEEGCLSLQGMRKVKRYREIRVEYYDRAFKKHTETFTGFRAQVIQHEYDHFSGKII